MSRREREGMDGAAAPSSAASRFFLSAEGLRKSYAGVVALANGSLQIRRGEIHGLLGENGAGKSTLIRSLAGTPGPDGGTIRVDGKVLPANHSAQHAREAGLAFIHQEGSLIETLSVAENIALSVGYPRRYGLVDWSAVRRTAEGALGFLGVELDPSRLVAELPPATKTVVAIARALAQHAQLLVLDEPTASASPHDALALFRVLRRLRAAGCAIVFVSHRLDEVYDICDRVTVLRDGVTVAADVPLVEIDKNALITLICGHEVQPGTKSSTARQGEPVLQTDGLRDAIVASASFSLWSGEILGFTGLSDAGHYELGELLFGLRRPVGGKMAIGRKPYRPRRPIDALARHVGYVPADRNVSGLARDMTLTENLFLNPRVLSNPNGPPVKFMHPAAERRLAASILRQFQVRPPMTEIHVGALSGGNAQKVMVARWLRGGFEVLIVNDPTVGVDVRAREEIYVLLRQAAERGAAILLITSDFDEIQSVADRAFVMVRGVMVRELAGSELTVADITAAIAARRAGGSDQTNRAMQS